MKTHWMAVALGVASCLRCQAEHTGWGSAGFRAGFLANSRNDNFSQYEAFATHNLGSLWQSDSGWFLQSRLDLSAGALYREGQAGFVGTFGPSLVLGKGDFPVTFEVGSSPTLLSRDKFENVDFGVPFQFTTHAGFGCRIYKQFSAGYRLQHMSNARLSRENPELNLHMFEVRYRF